MRMISDKYYGRQATEYDQRRSYKPDWQKEQDGVAEFVRHGPVLDCPLGTGRYVEIYKRKGLKHVGVDISKDMIAEARNKHPDIDAREASILDLPFGTREFQVVVCSRMLNWFYPEDMARAMGEIRRVGRELVVSLRTGEKGHHPHQGNYTHSLEDFLLTIDGMMIAGRKHLLSAPDGDVEMFHLRKPVWEDVEKQFLFHADGTTAIKRLSADWIAAYGLQPVDMDRVTIRGEHWSNGRIDALVNRMAQADLPSGKNEILTDEAPRFIDCPITILRTQEHEAMIDGRRRSNVWRNEPGFYPVLVIEANPNEMA